MNIDELEQGKENLKNVYHWNQIIRLQGRIWDCIFKDELCRLGFDEFQTAINLEPSNAEHYFNYAVALIIKHKNMPKLMNILKQHFELDKDNPAYLAYYGENLLALGKKDEAKKKFY